MRYLSTLLRITNQLRVYHWLCTSYSQHEAYGKAYEHFNELTDTFVETYMGKYGKSNAVVVYTIDLTSELLTSSDFINSSIDFLIKISNELEEVDTDLFNIRDEMISTLNQLKYLLTLS